LINEMGSFISPHFMGRKLQGNREKYPPCLREFGKLP